MAGKTQNRPVVVDGVRYNSIDEMPPDVRRVYERALAAQAAAEDDSRIKILYNGRQYDGIDSMPPEVRKQFEHEQASMETFRDFSVDSTQPRAVKPGSRPRHLMQGRVKFSLRKLKWPLMIAAIIAIGLIGWLIGRAII